PIEPHTRERDRAWVTHAGARLAAAPLASAPLGPPPRRPTREHDLPVGLERAIASTLQQEALLIVGALAQVDRARPHQRPPRRVDEVAGILAGDLGPREPQPTDASLAAAPHREREQVVGPRLDPPLPA